MRSRAAGYTKEEYAVESKFTTLLFRIIIQSMEGEAGLEFICSLLT